MVAPQYGSEDAARIKSLLRSGLSVNEVAEATGFTAYTVKSAVFAAEGIAKVLLALLWQQGHGAS